LIYAKLPAFLGSLSFFSVSRSFPQEATSSTYRKIKGGKKRCFATGTCG
jgi:hypothetical protein